MRLSNTNDGIFYTSSQGKKGEGFILRLKTIAGKGDQNIQPLPFAVYFWTVAALAVAGLVNAVYLSIIHYRVYTYPAYESFCAISKAVNCDTVSQSPYSVFWGVPVPVWGVIGFLFFLSFLPFAYHFEARSKRIWPILFIIALTYSIYSLVLATISSFVIKSYCIFCLFSFAITFALLFYTWLVRRRFDDERLTAALKKDWRYLLDRKKKVSGVLTSFLLILILVGLYYPTYWYFKPPALTTDLPFGVTEDGHPWIGAENAPLVITEYADYLCFQCNKTHYYLRRLLANYPGRIKLIHHHFPMDDTVNPLVKKSVHIGSGDLAKLAIYAGTQNKFWQMNDYLFSTARTRDKLELKAVADAVGLDAGELALSLHHPWVRSQLLKDITEGLKAGVRGTPTFVVNSQVYSGQIPMKIIADAIK